MNRNSYLSFAWPIILLLSGCGYLAVKFQPGKAFNFKETSLSRAANQYFWTNFHRGNYDNLPQVISRLNAAYLENPGNLKIMDHLGFANIWRYAESQRLTRQSPDILQNFILSRQFFDESYALNPADSRILGFLGDAKIVEGQISNNRQLTVEGYFDGVKSIHEWPQFNKFTLGYALSQTPVQSNQFKKALTWQWETLDDCECKTINKEHVDYAEGVRLIEANKDPAVRRACMNTWIAPHNLEGFFMNLGDMLVKSGDSRKGIEAYQGAMLAPGYKDWPYSGELAKRIAGASANVSNFNKVVDHASSGYSASQVMLVTSRIACMSCHQMSDAEFLRYGSQEPPLAFYQGKGQ